jgi:hypothetical protein
MTARAAARIGIADLPAAGGASAEAIARAVPAMHILPDEANA